jgi:DNA-binding response OmpR family regulator
MIDARVLIVGREDGIVRGWVDHLREGGANIAVVGDGGGALRHLVMLDPEVVLLDARLSGGPDGFDTCRAIRSRSGSIVVIAAERAGAYDEVVALAVGADAYVGLDVPVEVVSARLRALVRRARGEVLPDQRLAGLDGHAPGNGAAVSGRNGAAHAAQNGGQGGRVLVGARAGVFAGRGETSSARVSAAPTVGIPGPGADERIVEGDLEIDLVAREVRVDGSPTDLTRIEFDLLVTLARQPRRVFKRDQLMASAWDEPFDGSHVLDTHLSRLRGKITAAGGERVAHAVRGVGYRLRT